MPIIEKYDQYDECLPEGRRYARPLCTTAKTAKMAIMRKVESVEMLSSCSKKLFASPVPGAIHTCKGRGKSQGRPSSRYGAVNSVL